MTEDSTNNFRLSKFRNFLSLLVARLISKHSLSAIGFELRYQSTDEAPEVTYRMGDIGECGGTYTFPYGILTSPSYPSKYSINKDCVYDISQHAGTSILLNFISMDIEANSDCKYDYIEIRDGPSDSSPILEKLCGRDIPNPVRSTTNNMWIK